MEYAIAPTPIRANQVGAQQINPSIGLSYLNSVYRTLDPNPTGISNSATETSIFDLFPNSDDYLVRAGVTYIPSATSARTKISFPPNYFSSGGEADLDIVLSTSSNLAGGSGGYYTIKIYQLQTDPGVDAALSSTGAVSIVTDQRVLADGIVGVGLLKIIFALNPSESVAEKFNSFVVYSFIYKNNNELGLVTTTTSGGNGPSLNLTDSLVFNVTITWNTASTENNNGVSKINMDTY